MTRAPGRRQDPASSQGPAAPASTAPLEALFGGSTAVFASLAGPAHIVEAANGAFFRALGGSDRDRTGLPLAELAPELARQGLVTALDRVYRTGAGQQARDVRLLLGTGEDVRETWFDLSCEPRTGPAGITSGVTVVGVETTQAKHARRLADEHRALLEQIARQAPLHEILDGMARTIEGFASQDVLVSVLLADDDGRHLRHGAAPSLPDFYNRAIDGIATGEGVGSCGTAAHRSETVVVTDIATHPFWDDFRDLAQAAGLAACWSTPVLSRDGRLLGTFAVYHRTPRAPTDEDLALSRFLADTAALAIERHRAEEARQAAEARAEAARNDIAFLLEAGTAIAADLDHTGTLQRLADACAGTLAPLCAVDVVEAGRVRRVATAAPTVEQAALLAAHIPVYDAADDAVARVLASSTREVARRTPTGPGPWQELGVTGYLCLPLTDRGTPFGTVTLLSTGSHSFDGHTVALAAELARRASAAAVNARRHTERVRLTRDLQAGLLLADVPHVTGADIATHYHPAGESLDVGGDFYDVFPLGEGRWAVLLGDVCGRGAIAASTTALVRHTARAVAPLLDTPEAVVRAVNKALQDRPEQHGTGFVTLVYGELTSVPGGLDITLVRAGHTLPIHLDAHGRPRSLDVPGTLLGIGPDPHLTAHRLHLDHGEHLLLYTDGITEARDEHGRFLGERRLEEILARVPARAAAQQVVDHLVRGVREFTGPAVGDDDEAALVITAVRA